MHYADSNAYVITPHGKSAMKFELRPPLKGGVRLTTGHLFISFGLGEGGNYKRNGWKMKSKPEKAQHSHDRLMSLSQDLDDKQGMDDLMLVIWKGTLLSDNISENF